MRRKNFTAYFCPSFCDPFFFQLSAISLDVWDGHSSQLRQNPKSGPSRHNRCLRPPCVS